MYRENIEKIFKDDIREKKKIGSGAFHVRGKGVRHGSNKALLTPYHFMKTKERNKLSGEVTVSNMYTTILPIKEFELKDLATQKELLTRWREIHDNTHIRKEMGMNNAYYYELIKKLGVPKKPVLYKPRKAKAKVKPKPTKIIAIEASPAEKEIDSTWMGTETTMLSFVEPKQIVQAIPEPPTPSNGLNLQYNGEYTAEQLVKLFTKLQLITEGEENKFKLAINLIELA